MTYSQIKIELPEYYLGCGIIFAKPDSTALEISNFQCFVEPTLDNVKNSEDLLLNYVKSRNNKLFKDLKHYNRQYISYKNTNGENYLLIILLNFKNKKLASKYFQGWESKIILGFGEFYEKNMSIYKVNMNTGKVSLF